MKKEKTTGNSFKEAGPKKRRYRPFRSVRHFLDGSYLGSDITVGFIPYVLLLALLAMFSIRNIYKTEENQWKIIRLEQEIEDLKYEHVTTWTRVLKSGQRYDVSQKVKRTGLELPSEPPYQLTIRKP